MSHRKKLFVLFFSAWAIPAMPVHGQVPFFSSEDAGVSDHYLISLGTSAESHLIAALNDRRKEPYYLGIILRLETIGYIDEPNARIFAALKNFIEKQVRRDKDIGKTTEAVSRAFSVIGMRGGESGVDFLIAWVRIPAKINDVRCFRGGTVDQMRDQIFRAAILGLGFTGSPRGSTALSELLANFDLQQNLSIAAAIHEALALNRRVQANPLEGRYQLSRIKELGLKPLGLQVHGTRHRSYP